MIISLIGMSGSGKTHWSKKLAEEGFLRHPIDEMIGKILKKKLNKINCAGIDSVAKWMGQPNEPQYHANSNTYLKLEEDSMEFVFKMIEAPSKKQNIVIDTTGSVIYLNKHILKKLSEMTKIIYFRVPEKIKSLMFELFLKDPKPLIWGKIFKPLKGESYQETIARCYPQLLDYRTEHYQKIADVTLDVSLLKNPAFTISKFIKAIK